MWYISSVEVAQQFKNYRKRAISWKFGITATAVILFAAIVGGTIGSSRRFSSLTSIGANNSYRVTDAIERDYNAGYLSAPVYHENYRVGLLKRNASLFEDFAWDQFIIIG